MLNTYFITGFRHINDKDEKPKNVSLSLTILTNLCHHNYSVTTFVLSLISTEERKALIVKHNDDPVLQVCCIYINLYNGAQAKLQLY